MLVLDLCFYATEMPSAILASNILCSLSDYLFSWTSSLYFVDKAPGWYRMTAPAPRQLHSASQADNLAMQSLVAAPTLPSRIS
jgi:hypothetical protein